MKHSVTFPAVTDSISPICECVEEFLAENGCPMKTAMQLSVVIDELVNNVASYAYKTQGDITVEYGVEDSAAVITFIDSGIPYNPLERPDPDISLSADERQVGGLGIFMVKKMTDTVSYEHRDGCNRLTVTKKF